MKWWCSEWGIQRRRCDTNDGELRVKNSIPVAYALYWCAMYGSFVLQQIVLLNIQKTVIVLHTKIQKWLRLLLRLLVSFGAPQFPKQEAFGERGKMDNVAVGVQKQSQVLLKSVKSTGANRIAEGNCQCVFSLVQPKHC